MGELNDVISHDPAGVVATACLPREMAGNTGRLWTTTLLSRASSSRLGGAGWWPSPKSAVCIIATCGWRSLVPLHRTASRRPDDRERPGGRVKTES